MKKIIYCFHVHTRPQQIQRTISALDDQEVIFVIHVSKCVDIKKFHFHTQFNNLFYIDEEMRVPVYWGGFSQVLQTINSCQWIEENIPDYTHLYLLGESAYPIKPPKEIKEFFFNHCDKSYFRFSKIDTNCKWKQPIERLNALHVYDLIHFHRSSKIKNIIANFIKRTVKVKNVINYKLREFNYDIYAGSNWFIINKKMVNYINTFLSKNPKYIKLFKYCGLADELFFHTILLNSKHSSNIVNYNYLYVDWSNKKEWPKIFRKENFKKLSRIPHFFARKFNIDIDSKILDDIDKLIRRK